MLNTSSVIVPVRNVETWIAEALRSIDDIPGVATEIIVVDDRSTDGTRAVVAGLGDPRIRIVENAGTGPGEGRNTGLACATGAVIFALDGDDRYVPGGRAALFRALTQQPGMAAVAGACAMIDESGRRLTFGDIETRSRVITEDLRRGAFFHLSLLAVRAEVLREVGWARPYFRIGEDIDFLLRLSESHDVMFVPALVTECRIRSGSLSRARAGLGEFYIARAREFHRQRVAHGVDDLMAGKAPEPPCPGSGAPEPMGKFAVTMILAEAWRLRAGGRTRDARTALARAFGRAAFLPFALRPGLKLAAALVRDMIRPRRRRT